MGEEAESMNAIALKGAQIRVIGDRVTSLEMVCEELRAISDGIKDTTNMLRNKMIELEARSTAAKTRSRNVMERTGPREWRVPIPYKDMD